MGDSTVTDPTTAEQPNPADETPAEAPADDTTPAEPPGPDWKAEARKWERRAKDNATALTKAEARAEAAESLAAEKSREALRITAALEAGVTGKYVALVRGDDEASIRESAAMVSELVASKEPAPLHVPGEGRTPVALNDSDALTDTLKSALGIP
jgi:hypothetical protein